MSDMDLKTKIELLPCGMCEDMLNCDNCYHQKEAKDLYQQIRADAIDDISDLIRSKTYKVVGVRFDNTYEMHDRALGRLAKNVLIEELLEELEQLKEQKNEQR